MIKSLMLTSTLTLAFAAASFAAEPIVGKWKTASGDTAVISACASGYCITLKSGKYVGMQIGNMAGSGDTYTGDITDPSNKKTYSGKATITGPSLKMRGCVLNVLCRTQTWTRL